MHPELVNQQWTSLATKLQKIDKRLFPISAIVGGLPSVGMGQVTGARVGSRLDTRVGFRPIWRKSMAKTAFGDTRIVATHPQTGGANRGRERFRLESEQLATAYSVCGIAVRRGRRFASIGSSIGYRGLGLTAFMHRLQLPPTIGNAQEYC